MKVQKYNVAAGHEKAKQNFIVCYFGDAGTGKSYNLIRAGRPLYLVYLDPNPLMDYHLQMARKDGLTDEVYPLAFNPLPYNQLTQEEAERRVREIEQFAVDARAEKKGGVFGIDGAIMLKGLYERAVVGESPTLGYRPKKGERAPSTFEYAKSNNALRDLIQSFIGSDLDVVLTWEGRSVWAETTDGKTIKTTRMRSSMPDQLKFPVQANIETRLAVEKVDGVDTQVPKLFIHWVKMSLGLAGKTLPPVDFATLKNLFLASMPEVSAEQREVVQAAILDKEPVKSWVADGGGEELVVE